MAKRNHIGNPQPNPEVQGAAKRETLVLLLWGALGTILGAVLFGGLGFLLMGFIGLISGIGLGGAIGGIYYSLYYLNSTTP